MVYRICRLVEHERCFRLGRDHRNQVNGAFFVIILFYYFINIYNKKIIHRCNRFRFSILYCILSCPVLSYPVPIQSMLELLLDRRTSH